APATGECSSAENQAPRPAPVAGGRCSRLSRSVDCLGGQTFKNPAGALDTVVEAIVQATRTALPELDALGQQAVTTPVLGAVGLGIAESLLGALEQGFQLTTVGDHPALR